jgi:glycosyltransferase involved in cell wall biosynthesis
MSEPDASRLDLSIVIPCLNEHETIETCVRKARQGLEASGWTGEVVVADNGSTDGSVALARSAGARIVNVPRKGYGAALLGGVAAARGRWVIMGDADDSYDFLQVPRFAAKLAEGYDLVQGCRLPRGGGTVEPGAMPFLHRYLGNPGFSLLARWWFGLTVHDVHCGMRGFRRELVEEIGQRCLGMEFATEMLIKARLHERSVTEIPITLHRDGRVEGRPHLRTFRDGWRHLRFYLLFSPTWLFLVPGLALMLLGALGGGIALAGARVGGIHFDVSTLLVSSASLVVGFQAIVFGFLTRVYGVTQGLFPWRPRFDRWFEHVNLERGIAAGAAVALAGVGLLGWGVLEWWAQDFGPLDYQRTLRVVIPGATLLIVGVQTVLASFFFSLLGLETQ